MSNLPSLYTLATEFSEAADKLADLDLDEQTLADTLEGLQGDLTVKAQNVAQFVRNIEAIAEAKEAAARELGRQAKSLEKRADGLRRYILESMKAGAIQKIETPWFRITTRKNPPSVVIDAPSQIPAEYWRIPDPPPAEIDKAAIKRALADGKEVAGAHVEQTERIEIK